MLSIYCFRGLPRLRLPSTYPSTTVLVIWQPWSLQSCPTYESLRLRTYPRNSRFMSSYCRILVSVIFSIQLMRFILRQSHISIDVIFRSADTFIVQASAPYDKTVHINILTNLTFSATGMARSFHRVVSLHIIRFAIAMLECIFGAVTVR